MFGSISIVNPNTEFSEVESLLLKDGLLQSVAYSELKRFSQAQISLFCRKHAIYQIVTTELIDWLKNEIGDAKAIEIGSGNGCLGRTLGIPLTDSCQQNWDWIRLYYALQGQPTIKYPKDIIPYDANVSVDMFKPDVVVGAWVTQLSTDITKGGNQYGIDERLFKGKIKKYILVGHENIHGDKDILSMFPYKTYKFDWLVSRSMSKDLNLIYVFDCQ